MGTMSNEAYSNNESSLNQVERSNTFKKNEENKSGLPSHCSELYGCQTESRLNFIITLHILTQD